MTTKDTTATHTHRAGHRGRGQTDNAGLWRRSTDFEAVQACRDTQSDRRHNQRAACPSIAALRGRYPPRTRATAANENGRNRTI